MHDIISERHSESRQTGSSNSFSTTQWAGDQSGLHKTLYSLADREGGRERETEKETDREKKRMNMKTSIENIIYKVTYQLSG